MSKDLVSVSDFTRRKQLTDLSVSLHAVGESADWLCDSVTMWGYIVTALGDDELETLVLDQAHGYVRNHRYPEVEGEPMEDN